MQHYFLKVGPLKQAGIAPARFIGCHGFKVHHGLLLLLLLLLRPAARIHGIEVLHIEPAPMPMPIWARLLVSCGGGGGAVMGTPDAMEPVMG